MSSKINLVLDMTQLDTFIDCPEKFNLRFNKNKSEHELAVPLDTGILAHTGEENYYKELSESRDWVKAVDKGLTAVRVQAAESSDLPSDDITRVLEVLEESWTVWRAKDLGYEILAVEKPFAFVLYEDEQMKITIIGKIDLLINDPPNYYHVPIDHKTFRRDFPLRRIRNQFCCYSYAVQSPYLFVNRLGLSQTIGVGNKRSSKPEDRHTRFPLSYDKLYWEQWKRNTVKWVFMYYDCAQEDHWPMNPTSCDKYGRECEYYQVCDTSGEENKIYKLNTFFKDTEPWDVSKALMKKD